jgi:hypothetical protein
MENNEIAHILLLGGCSVCVHRSSALKLFLDNGKMRTVPNEVCLLNNNDDMQEKHYCNQWEDE